MQKSKLVVGGFPPPLTHVKLHSLTHAAGSGTMIDQAISSRPSPEPASDPSGPPH